MNSTCFKFLQSKCFRAQIPTPFCAILQNSQLSQMINRFVEFKNFSGKVRKTSGESRDTLPRRLLQHHSNITGPNQVDSTETHSNHLWSMEFSSVCKFRYSLCMDLVWRESDPILTFRRANPSAKLTLHEREPSLSGCFFTRGFAGGRTALANIHTHKSKTVKLHPSGGGKRLHSAQLVKLEKRNERTTTHRQSERRD